MLAFRSLVRVNLLARRTTLTCVVQSNTSIYTQKYKFYHGFSCDLKMNVRKGRFDFDRRNRKNVTQTWRAVSTLPIPNSYEGESSAAEGLNEPVSVDACPTTEASKVDISLDETLVPSEKHSVSMEVGRSLMHFITGKGGVTQKEIEAETGVQIVFPSLKTEDFIIIEGTSAESVTKASEKIKIIIDKAVNSRDLDYSHFVSLPLAIHPGLVDKLVNFQNTILGIEPSDNDKTVDSDTDGGTSDEEEEDQQSIKKPSKVLGEVEAEKDDAHVEVNIMSNRHSTKAPVVAELKAEDANTSVRAKITNIPIVSYSPKESKSPEKSKETGIEKSIFIKPKTLHLTVLMLKLWNKERVKTAAEVLQSVSSKVMDALENRPLLIKLKGLDCMRGPLGKARVLYAPVEEIGDKGRLLRACQVISDAFVEAGLVIERDVQHTLKLHATIMNTRHRKRKKGTKKLYSFDARGIFDLYGSEEWGEYPIHEAHLSQRFAFDESGYYQCCASIPFPDKVQVD